MTKLTTMHYLKRIRELIILNRTVKWLKETTLELEKIRDNLRTKTVGSYSHTFKEYVIGRAVDIKITAKPSIFPNGYLVDSIVIYKTMLVYLEMRNATEDEIGDLIKDLTNIVDDLFKRYDNPSSHQT